MKKNVISVFIIVVLAFCMIFTIVNIDSWLTKDSGGNISDIALDMNSITIDGEKYVPKNISTYLFIGIDKNGNIDVETYSTEQSDFILCLVCNHDTKKYNFIHVNRDSMVKVNRISGFTGESLGSYDAQIALSHTYGVNETAKSENTIMSFKNLFNGMTVNNFLSFTMSAVSVANDMICGEEGLSITIDSTTADANLGYTEGQTVKLKGEEALNFVRSRTNASDSTNIARMVRQKTYINALLTKSKDVEISFIDIFDEVVDYIETNMSSVEVAKLTDYLLNYEYDGIVSPTGEAVMGSRFVEFNVDESSVNAILKQYCYDKR